MVELGPVAAAAAEGYGVEDSLGGPGRGGGWLILFFFLPCTALPCPALSPSYFFSFLFFFFIFLSSSTQVQCNLETLENPSSSCSASFFGLIGWLVAHVGPAPRLSRLSCALFSADVAAQCCTRVTIFFFLFAYLYMHLFLKLNRQTYS